MAVLQANAPEEVVRFLKHPCIGQVLLVTSKGLYLELEQQILLLCPDRWGVTPIGLSMADYPKLLQLQPAAGQPVTWQPGCLTFPGGDLPLELISRKEKNISGNFSREILRKTAEELLAQNRSTGLSRLAAPLLLNRMPENADIYCQLALPGFSHLMEGLKTNQTSQITQAVLTLLGLGTGLTPSGDDVLCGMLYVLLRSSRKQTEGVKALISAIRENAPQKTNAISAAYLTALADGAPYERMEITLAAIMTGQPEGIRYLTEVGSNSGSEMLLGMLLAGNLLCCMEE